MGAILRHSQPETSPIYLSIGASHSRNLLFVRDLQKGCLAHRRLSSATGGLLSHQEASEKERTFRLGSGICFEKCAILSVIPVIALAPASDALSVARALVDAEQLRFLLAKRACIAIKTARAPTSGTQAVRIETELAGSIDYKNGLRGSVLTLCKTLFLASHLLTIKFETLTCISLSSFPIQEKRSFPNMLTAQCKAALHAHNDKGCYQNLVLPGRGRDSCLKSGCGASHQPF